MSELEPKFKAGEWVSPNPTFMPSGVRDGRLKLGTDYMVLYVSKTSISGDGRNFAYEVECDDGSKGRWVEKCWIQGKPREVMLNLDWSLEEIEAAQEAYKICQKL